MKKYFYIASFTFLGLLFQQVVHGVLEVSYINLLVKDFETYSFGLSWDAWYIIHAVGTVVLLLIGVGVGLWQGLYWQKRLYGQSND